MRINDVDGLPVIQLDLDNGWTVSLRVYLRKPYEVSCIAFPTNTPIMQPPADIGPQEATDDEVAGWIADVAAREPYKAA